MFKKIMYLLSCVILYSCISERRIHQNTNWGYYPEYTGKDYYVSYFEETPEAFPNPMKGFRPGMGPGDFLFTHHQYGRVYRQYVKYSDLEISKKDTVQKIIDWSNRAWAGIEKRNIKVIPRVVLTYPINNQHGAMSNNFWPNDISQPNSISRWSTKELMDRLSNFIKKLGEAWDNDPRVAAIELGLWGYWGEHHLLNDGRISASMQKVLGDAFSSAFRNKKVMVRYPETFTGYQFGFYWDSFALSDDNDSGDGMIRRNLWRNQMIGGEVAYDWGNRAQLGRTPNETVENDNYTNYLINWIKRVHATSLGWVADYDQGNPKLKENAAKIQKALGYRFVIRSAIFNKKANSGESIEIGIKMSNVGSAPFYYQWPIEISLLNHEREFLYSKIVYDINITTWLPDETQTIYCKIDVPKKIENGTYIIALSILDPSGNNPSIRFANTNYYKGGRTPLGVLGINQEPEFIDLAPFDYLYNDNSLGYELITDVTQDAFF